MAITRQPWQAATALGLILAAGLAPQAMAQDASEVPLETITVEDDSSTTGTSANTTITAQAIEKKQAQSVAEAVSDVAGVSVARENDLLTSNITIRNFGGNSAMPDSQHVVYALDGVATAGGNFYRNSAGQVVDPTLLKSVSVLKGPLASLEYGSGIVGGTIKMETINGRDLTGEAGGFRYRQVLGANSNGDGWKTASTVAWANDSFDLLASYARTAKDNSKDGNGDEIDLGAYNVPSYLLKGRYRFGQNNDQSITLSYDKSESVQQNVPFATSSMISAFGNVNRTRDGHVASVSYKYQPVNNPLVDFDLTYSQSRQDFDVEGLSFISSMFAGSYSVDTDTLSATNTAQFATGRIQHSLRAGVSLVEIDHDGIMSGVAGEGKARRSSVFAIDEMDFGHALTVSLGGRVEHQKLTDLYSSSGTALDDMSSTARSLGAGFEKGLGVYDLSLYGSFTYSEGLTLPEYAGRAWGDGSYWGETVSKSRSWELGVKQATQGALAQGDQLTASVGLYRIDLDDNNAYPSNTYQDLRSAGLEVALSYQMANGVYARSSLTTSFYNDYTNDSMSGEADYDYAITDHVSMTLGRDFGNGWDLSWTLRAAKAQTINGMEQTGWGVNDLAIGYTVQAGALDGLKIDFGIDNVFDKQYVRQYTTSSASYAEAGRDVRLTLSKTF